MTKQTMQPIDHWHHEFLRGNPEAKEPLESLINAGFKAKDPKAIAIKKSLEKTKNISRKSLLMRRYNLEPVAKVAKPLYNFMWFYLMGLFLFMLALNEGFNVI